jgi:hypothetical protein
MKCSTTICPQCLQAYSDITCPFCALQRFATAPEPPPAPKHVTAGIQRAGQVMNASSSTALSTSGSSSNPYTVASWDDFELAYPFLWPAWAANKLLDPSQERDSATRRNQLGGIAQQLNRVVAACANLPDTDRSNWKTFAASFLPWYQNPDNDQAVDDAQAALIQDQLRGWQIEISKFCNIGMPVLPQSTPTFGQLGQAALEDVGKWFDTIKFMLVGGIVLLAVSVAIVGVDNTRKIVMKYV